MVKLSPLRKIAFISYTSSSDEKEEVPCKIDESRYKIKDGYKICLKSIYPEFGKEYYYLNDLQALINEGSIRFYIQKLGKDENE